MSGFIKAEEIQEKTCKSQETRMHPHHDSSWQVSLLRVTGKLKNNEELHKEHI